LHDSCVETDEFGTTVFRRVVLVRNRWFGPGDHPINDTPARSYRNRIQQDVLDFLTNDYGALFW
jgi:hypothetical protein